MQINEKEGHLGGGVRLSRSGSPYPHGPKVARHQQTGSRRVVRSSPSPAVSDRRTEQKILDRASFSGEPDARPTRSSQRTTSIRWAENLPIPHRDDPSSSFDEHAPSPEAQQAAFQKANSDMQDKTGARIPGHAKHLAEQRAYIARENIEKTRHNQEIMTSDTSMQKASAAEYIPPHKRGIKPKFKVEVGVSRQEQPITKSYYAESDTESSSGSVNPRVPFPEHSQESTPLTLMTLKDLPKRQGMADKSKKSHTSMDVSVDDEATSSHEYGSSRLSNSFDKMKDADHLEPLSGFFRAWVATLSSDCITSFLDEVENHHNHDVDPTNGQLLEKIEQPDTVVNIEEEASMKPAMLHRRRDWTSNLVIHREISIRKNLMRRQQEHIERERCNLPTQVVQEWEPKEKTHVPGTPRSSLANDRKLLADCVLRPVQLSDANGCAEIYNAAVTDCDHQLVDTNPVSAERFEFIVAECQREKLPFVVAVVQKVDLSDAKNWPSLDAYRQYMKWKQSQPEEAEPTGNGICGFAFLKPYERGIGGLTGTASPTVKATVFVRPDHRRGGIGSALLHQLLTQTSILYYGNVAKYKWEDPANGEDPFRTLDFRKVHRIIVHTMVESEGNQSFEWMDNFMTSFQFEKSGRLNQVYSVDTPHGVEWYDQIVWQHWANKIDSVRTLYVGDESECSYDYPGKPHSPRRCRVQSPPIAGKEPRYGSDDDGDVVFGH